jgi:hypothetical protein
MKYIQWLTFMVLGTAALPALAADSATGRIFFTPEQRVQLDMLREKKAIASQIRDEPIPETVTFNGIVRSSDGKTTVWLNNEVLSEPDLRNKQSIVGSISKNGQVTLQAPQAAVELKVGQSATLFSGKVDESFTQRNPPAPKKTVEPVGKPPAQQPADKPSDNKTSGPEENRKAAPKT